MFNHWLVLSSNLHSLKFSTIDVFMFHTYNNCYYGTCGDGNCLYRACSKLLCGKEDLCYFLRGFTSIELYSNQEFYAFNPYVRENAHIFRCENIAFSASVSDSALGDGYNGKDPSSRKLVVQRETIRNAKSGTHASSLFTCLVVSYLVWVFVHCTQKSWGRRIYTQNF